jgi:membrane protease YdiL (CAAX protease family)
VFVGVRRVVPEAVRGLLLVPVVFLAVALIVLGLRAAFPWMHTVEQNPLEAFMRTPVQAAVFLIVVVLAGGVREELQRAFILHRFERYLGGIHIGLVLFVAIGVLGLWWGLVYIRRRSAVLPLVNHAGFNALQVVQAVMVKAFGG